MTAFFGAQLGPILFIYGLAFILFGATCVAIARIGGREEAWVVLGLFGFFHGTGEWLDLIAMVGGDTTAFGLVRLTVMTASFVLLTEFARREALRLGLAAPGPWAYIPFLALVAAVAVIDGKPAGEALARYIFGFFGALATSLVFARFAPGYSGFTKRLAMCVAAGFTAYAVAAGIIVPAGRIWPTDVINYDWFSHVTGIPIQLVRAMLACSLAFCIWSVWGKNASQRMARVIVDTALDAFLQMNETGTVIDWSPKAEAMFGWSRREAIGRKLSDLIIPPENRAAHAERLAEFLKNARHGNPGRRYEAVSLRRDGKRINTEGSVSALRRGNGYVINCFIRDITERVQVENDRDRNREFLDRIIENISIAILVKDARDLRYVLVNKAAEELLGLPRGQIVGRTARDIFPAATADVIDNNDDQLLISKSNFFVGEHAVQSPDGRTRLVTTNRLTISKQNGEVQYILGVVEDVTERRAMEDQLRQSQKMESIGQLTGGIAHDFNNMLQIITGTIDLFRDAVQDKPHLASIVKLISEAADRGADLTGHLLAFARRQPLQPCATDINALTVQSEKLLRRTLGGQIDIELRLEQAVWPALVDPTQLTTALLNLAVNARDAMPNGGKLTLETSNFVVDESCVNGNRDVHREEEAPRSGSYVVIAVRDTGCGIPEAIRQRVFEPFFTTKAVGKGTGLGLSMVYGFIKQSNGYIKLCSEDGQGTTFKLYLPRAAADVVQAMEVPETALAGGSETILVVEDDPLVRSSLIIQLQGLGYQTLAAANAAEALAIADRGEPFDLLLTDVIMPGGMNGRELSEEMAKRRSPLKVLFTSGYAENAIVHHGRVDPGVHLLVKPYRESHLASMARQILAGIETFPPPDWDQRRSQSA
jgi:PAS domain S-box-containing protein